MDVTGAKSPNEQLSHVLVVDDDEEILALLRGFLQRHGYGVSLYSSATEALAALKKGQLQAGDTKSLDVIISDWKMPEMSGIEFVSQAKEIQPEVPIILATAYGSIEGAIEAIRKGTFDYVVKPLRLNELKITLDRAIQFRKLHRDNQILREEIRKTKGMGEMIGKSPAIEMVFDLVRRVSQTKANVLITGESGTGKEMVARAIHNGGPRAKKPFVAINCTAIPENLLESELFGHSKGSFTGATQARRGLFAEANGGTIFLDEIGDMPGSLQVKLLRVIQERKIRPVGENAFQDIDVRLVAATHRDLRSEIKEGRFREDLFYRLSVIPILIPPLRERKEDIQILADHFVRKYSAANGSPVTGLTRAAMAKLINLSWEGNVRELENVIERAVTLCSAPVLDVQDIVTHGTNKQKTEFFEGVADEVLPLREVEKRYIEIILQRTNGEKKEAAALLGIDRKTLYRKECEYGLKRET